jgi:hypothetical protein
VKVAGQRDTLPPARFPDAGNAFLPVPILQIALKPYTQLRVGPFLLIARRSHFNVQSHASGPGNQIEYGVTLKRIIGIVLKLQIQKIKMLNQSPRFP